MSAKRDLKKKKKENKKRRDEIKINNKIKNLSPIEFYRYWKDPNKKPDKYVMQLEDFEKICSVPIEEQVKIHEDFGIEVVVINGKDGHQFVLKKSIFEHLVACVENIDVETIKKIDVDRLVFDV